MQQGEPKGEQYCSVFSGKTQGTTWKWGRHNIQMSRDCKPVWRARLLVGGGGKQFYQNLLLEKADVFFFCNFLILPARALQNNVCNPLFWKCESFNYFKEDIQKIISSCSEHNNQMLLTKNSEGFPELFCFDKSRANICLHNWLGSLFCHLR